MRPVSFRRVGPVASRARGSDRASTFRPHIARAAANGKDVPDGDKETQEALVDMIRLNVNKSRFLEQLDAFTDMEKRKIRHQAAEANQRIDEYAETNAARIDDQFQAASAEIDKQYQAVHEDLQKSRERLEADTSSFEALRAKVQADRQAGLFYKTLYTDPLAKDAPQYQAGFQRARTAAAAERRTRGAERFLWRFSLIYILASLASLGMEQAAEWKAWFVPIAAAIWMVAYWWRRPQL